MNVEQEMGAIVKELVRRHHIRPLARLVKMDHVVVYRRQEKPGFMTVAQLQRFVDAGLIKVKIQIAAGK